jgi:hypothetical protein
MSLNEAVMYEFQKDMEPQVNSYPSLGANYLAIPDTNQGNYLNNWINFSSKALVGATTEDFLNYSNGYAGIPYTLSLTATNCLFGDCTARAGGVATGARTMADLDENAFAVGIKNYLHFIDNYSLKVDNTQLNSAGNPLANIMMQEKLKKMSDEQYRLYSDIICHSWDSTESYNMNPVAGTRFKDDANENIGLEINNNTVPVVANALQGSNPFNFANKGHIERMKKTNHDLNSADYIYKKIMTADKIANTQQSVFKGVSTDKKTLTWTGVAIIPLSLLSDFIANMGTVQASRGLELKLQTNIGANNSWTYNFTMGSNPAIADAILNSVLTDQYVSAIQSIGNTCPFMLSPPAYKSNTGLSVYPQPDATACSLTITSKIGYDGANAIPCILYIPVINLNPILAQEILTMKEPQRILYDDYQIEWIENVSGTAPVHRSFPNEINRPRKMLIFPFLSKSVGAKVPCYQQCTSSAPNTVTPVKLIDFQIKRGLKPIFAEKLQYNFQYYNNHYLPMECVNGASFKSPWSCGQITKSMWERIYGVYEFDLTGALDELQDNLPKSFTVDFKVDTVAGLTYDFLVVFTSQSEMYLHRGTGLITSPSQQ